LGDLVLHAEPDTLEVDGDRVIPVFLGAVSRWSVRPRNTGVVMRIIQSAVGLHDLLNQRFNLGCFGDIGPHKKSISTGLFDYSYGLLTALDKDVGNDSFRPFSGKRHCACPAYSRGGTRGCPGTAPGAPPPRPSGRRGSGRGRPPSRRSSPPSRADSSGTSPRPPAATPGCGGSWRDCRPAHGALTGRHSPESWYTTASST